MVLKPLIILCGFFCVFGATLAFPAISIADVRLIGSSHSLGEVNSSANRFRMARFQCASSGTLNSLNYVYSSLCHIKMALYSDSAGSPGSLLTSSAEYFPSNCGSACAVPVSPISITQGTYYWIAFITDSNCLAMGEWGTTALSKDLAYSGFNFPNPAGSGFGSIAYEPYISGWGVVDITPPVISGLSDASAPTKSKTWAWGSDDPTAIYRYLVDQNATSTPSGSYESATTTSQASGNGTYYIHVQAKDAAGNESAVTTVLAILDNTAPAITVVNPNTIPAQGKTVSASISDGTLEMSNTTGFLCDSSLSFVAYTSQTFTSEANNGTRVCYKGADEAGNVAYSLSNAISGIDATPSTITNLTNDTTPKKTKTWTWSGEAGDTFRFVIDQNSSGIPSGSYSSTATATQSSGNGTYYLHVQSKDASNNESDVVTVSVVLDNIAPTITVTGDNPANINFNTTFADAGAIASDNIDSSITVTTTGTVNTGAAGTYTLTYSAADTAGNAATVQTRTVIVGAQPSAAVGGQFAIQSHQANLLAKIQFLKQEITRLRALLVTRNFGAPINPCALAKDLSYGMKTDPQVKCLQEFLKSQGAIIYPEAKVTGNFFDATKAAVIRFQEKHAAAILAPYGLTNGNGLVGPKTREVINGIARN